jgi:hypothetical protein
VPRHDLEVLVALPSIAILEFHARVREADPTLLNRQAMLAGPVGDLARASPRPAVTHGSPVMALLEESLIVPLQLVVDDNAANTSSALADSRLCSQVGAVDPRVVGQLARLLDAYSPARARTSAPPQPGVELLARPALHLAAVGPQQVAAGVGQDDDVAVARVETDGLDEPAALQMPEARGVLAISSIALSRVAQVFDLNDTERADGGQQPTLVAVQVVRAVAIAHALSLGTARQIDITQERISWVAIVERRRCAFVSGAPAALADLAAKGFTAGALLVSRIVAVEHVAFSSV